MSQLFMRRIWMQAVAVVLALALNLGALDGIINGMLEVVHTIGLTDSLHKVNNVPNAYADPGSGEFDPGVFDPNHDKTSTLSFKFDYDHDTKVELYKDGEIIKTLAENNFYRGKWHDQEEEESGAPPRNITNQFKWDGKDDNGEPIDDGVYTIILTPLDEWSIYPLEADVRVRNVPHTPVIKSISINQSNGTVTFSGTSQPKHVIHMYHNGAYFFSTTANDKGLWWIYNKSFTNETIHTVFTKAENQARHWPTLSEESNRLKFLPYKIKTRNILWNLASFYLGNGTKWTQIQKATGLQGDTIYAGNWLLILNPIKGGAYAPKANSVPKATDKVNGKPQKPVGDPMNPVSGNYYTQKEDLVVPGRGLPFGFVRTYNSQSDYRGHLGFGWDYNLNKSLIFFTDGKVGHQRGDGGLDMYTPDNGGRLVPPVGVYDNLQANGDGTYHLTKKDRTVFNFDTAGRLVSILDRNGNSITITYNEEGHIDYVTDTVGRKFNFTYDSEQRIIEISDTTDRKVKYAYDSNSNLTSVTDINGRDNSI